MALGDLLAVSPHYDGLDARFGRSCGKPRPGPAIQPLTDKAMFTFKRDKTSAPPSSFKSGTQGAAPVRSDVAAAARSSVARAPCDAVQPIQAVEVPRPAATVQPAPDESSTHLHVNDGLQAAAGDLNFDETSAQDWKKLRKPLSVDDRRINDAGMAWVATLPRELRPLNIIHSHPHVANLLASMWDRPAELPVQFENLINSRRTQRAGFPTLVKVELTALRAFARQQGRST